MQSPVQPKGHQYYRWPACLPCHTPTCLPAQLLALLAAYLRRGGPSQKDDAHHLAAAAADGGSEQGRPCGGVCRQAGGGGREELHKEGEVSPQRGVVQRQAAVGVQGCGTGRRGERVEARRRTYRVYQCWYTVAW